MPGTILRPSSIQRFLKHGLHLRVPNRCRMDAICGVLELVGKHLFQVNYKYLRHASG